MSLLDCVEIEPAQEARSAVIWLHGLGADGHDFEPIVPYLKIDPAHATRFVFPHAPQIAVTINNGYVMPAWYDIVEMNLERKVDEIQLRQSAASVRDLIARENERGVPSERIIIAGFSQGGAVAFELALSYPERLAGLIALSTYFATRNTIETSSANAGLGAFIGHGLRDPVVPESLGQDSYRALAEMGYDAVYHTYNIEHSVDMTEIQDIGAWINQTLAG